MSDLTKFLLARIREDEEEARATFRLDVTTADGSFATRFDCSPAMPPNLARVVTDETRKRGAGGAFVFNVHPDPARVLAECEAKRRLVKWARMFIRQSDSLPDTEEHARKHGVATGFDMVLSEMAAVYSAHPDYRQEWAT